MLTSKIQQRGYLVAPGMSVAEIRTQNFLESKSVGETRQRRRRQSQRQLALRRQSQRRLRLLRRRRFLSSRRLRYPWVLDDLCRNQLLQSRTCLHHRRYHYEIQTMDGC